MLDLTPLGAGLAVLVGVLVGGFGHHLWARDHAKARRRIPKHWPVDPRPIVNSQEVKVWRWLHRVFPDQRIMVKIPITRFTTPQVSQDGGQLYELLSKVYCTFTVCTPSGKVLGCIDVKGRKALSRSNQLLKLGLLSQCGICYWGIEPDAFPEPNELKAYFLAEEPQQFGNQGVQALASAQVQLRDAVNRRRNQRSNAQSKTASRTAPPDPAPPSSFFESEFAQETWQQADSFIAPLDSRLAALH